MLQLRSGLFQCCHGNQKAQHTMQRCPSLSRDLLTLTLCICLTPERSFNPVFSLVLSPDFNSLPLKQRISHMCTLRQPKLLLAFTFTHTQIFTQTCKHASLRALVHKCAIFVPRAYFSLCCNSIRKTVAWSKQDMMQRQM